MNYEYLMNTATGMYFLCYIPELYANYKNKNANIYNLPEKAIMFIATALACAYAILNGDTTLTVNYASSLGLDFIALIMRAYYAYLNRRESHTVSLAPNPTIQIQDQETVEVVIEK